MQRPTKGMYRLAGVCGLAALALTSGSADAAQVLIDFGSGTTTTTDAVSRRWNTINSGDDLTGSPFTLLNTQNTDSGYRLSISNPDGVTNPIGFNGENANGTTSPTGQAAARNYPSSATRDSLYGNSSAFGEGIVQAVRLTLSNLNPAETYSLAFFASRTSVTDNRETEYAITGGNGASSLFLDAANNTGNLVERTGITPDANNQIIIDIDAGPNNTNTPTAFYYLGVMEINSVPEPAALGLSGLAAAGLLTRRRRVEPRVATVA